MPRRSVVAALVLIACAVGAATALAAFSKTTSNGANTVTAKRIFPTTETTPAWVVSDQADGTAADGTDPGYLTGDLRTWNTGNWATAFSTTRYIETAYASPLPPGLSVSGMSMNFDYRATNSGDTVCFYFEVRRTSTGAVLGTHGSTASPVRCATGTAVQTTSTSLPEITTSDDANDITIRTYMRVSGARPITGDLGTITGTAGNGYGSFSIAERSYIDRATGTAGTYPYALFAADGTSAPYTAWTTAFSSTRFLTFTFPTTFVPSGATITSVTYTNRFRSSTSGRSACFYYEFRNGATTITSRGSTTTPYGCSDTANNWRTETISLPEVNTAAEVNGLVARVYGRDTGSSGSSIDQQQLSVTYYLD